MIGKVFTKSCCLTFHYPWTKFLGKSSVGQRDSVVTLLQELRLPLKCQSSEVVSFWPVVKWNSRAGQMTIFGTQKSLLSNNILHLASLNPNYTAGGQGMHRCLAKIIRVQESFLKSLNVWSFHYPLAPCCHTFCKMNQESQTFKRQKSALLSYSYIY